LIKPTSLNNRILEILLIVLFYLFPLLPVLPASAGESAIQEIRTKPTFHQRVEGFTLSLTPSEMEYFLDNFHYASRLLNRYGIHSLRILSLEDQSYYAEDDRGLHGTFKLVEKDGSYREYMGGGSIHSRVAGEIRARVIADVYYHEAGSESIQTDIDFWVLVDNTFLHFLCRIFKPVLTRIFTQKVEVFINVIQELAERVRSNPDIINQVHPPY